MSAAAAGGPDPRTRQPPPPRLPCHRLPPSGRGWGRGGPGGAARRAGRRCHPAAGPCPPRRPRARLPSPRPQAARARTWGAAVGAGGAGAKSPRGGCRPGARAGGGAGGWVRVRKGGLRRARAPGKRGKQGGKGAQPALALKKLLAGRGDAPAPLRPPSPRLVDCKGTSKAGGVLPAPGGGHAARAADCGS